MAHYLYFAFTMVAYLKVKPTQGSSKSYMALLVYMVTYCVVKIAGEYAYAIRWFPYITFDLQSFADTLHVGIDIGVVLLVLVFAVPAVGYFGIFFCWSKEKTNKSYTI